MRILFVVHQFYPEYSGGTEKVTYQLAKSAQRAGHFVRVLTCRVLEWPKESESILIDSVYNGIPVTAFHRLYLSHNADIDLAGNTELIEPITHLLDQEQYDVAHVMHTMRMGTVLDVIQSHGLPYVMTLTDFFSECYRINLVTLNGDICDGAGLGDECKRSCLRAPWSAKTFKNRSLKFQKLLSGASHLVCPSDYVREKFEQEYCDLNFRVIEHGIDLVSAIKQSSNMSAVQTGNDTLLQFCFVGSFVPEKGIECLIRAFKRTTAKNIRLNLYGGFFGLDAYEKTIRSLISGDSRIKLEQFVEADSIFRILRQTDVLCLPSLVPESFSLVLREAAAVGTPSLVTNLGAPNMFVSQHSCGGIVESGNINAWAEKMQSLAGSRESIDEWSANLPLPYRAEEEGFFYRCLYAEI